MAVHKLEALLFQGEGINTKQRVLPMSLQSYCYAHDFGEVGVGANRQNMTFNLTLECN